MSDSIVDTNVLLDLTHEDKTWLDWSRRAVAEAADGGALVLTPVVYSELAGAFHRREDADRALSGFRREHLPWDAAFMAGMAFVAYRRRGGTRTSPLPDFFIGAHAAVRGYRLITRDRGYYRTYFPTIDIVSPPGTP